jgi:hypothetical protein
MHDILDLESFPLHDLESRAGRVLVARCQRELAETGMFNLDGLVRSEALAGCVDEVVPELERNAYAHTQLHNIYFQKHVEGIDPDHPALRQSRTSNRQICGDQMEGFVLTRIYEWPPLAVFLAKAMSKPVLYIMEDPLARVNVMSYTQGEALNWHFDRSEFTTTLLIQAAGAGGEFQYRSDLRSDDDPNYEGVARLLDNEDEEVRKLPLTAGTLNVFRGKNTAHRVTAIEGGIERIIAVFSYYEQPGVNFSEVDRIKFYGRGA